VTYNAITCAIRTGKGFIGTIEFFPEEGKYHFDGHKACGICLSPEETIALNYLCPRCGKRVTIGVMHRVERLADREKGFVPKDSSTFCRVIPLPEIIAEVLNTGVNSSKVIAEYLRLLDMLGNEVSILIETPLNDIELAGSHLLREAISRMRKGKVQINPVFDGKYGRVRIFGEVALH